ncbi:MAG TPA: cardiolipin synthase [Xanthomonadaceae bacterium]
MHLPFALPEHVLALLWAVWLCYLVALAVWIVIQQREPVATLSWLLALAALPFVGFLIYYAFGPQRIRRQARRRLRSQAAAGVRRMDVAGANAGLELGRVGTATTGYPMTTSTRAQLLVDGAATFDAIVEAIDAAQRHVHVEYYIFVADASGTRFRDALVARARAGVKVRLLLDGVGSRALRGDFLAPLLDAGAEVAWFHPVRWWLTAFLRPKLNLRTHRKIVVCDGCTGFTGGINVTDDENERVNPSAYHDLHLRFDGDAARWLQVAWIEDWCYATGQVLRESDLGESPAPGPVCTQILPSGPDNPWEPIHRVHVEAIHRAEHRVWLATPYFVPSQAALFALGGAAMRGLDVRLVVPERSDSRLVDACARSYFEHLQKAGVRVYRYGPRMLHAKALLVDDGLALIGTANMDSRSFRLNFEISVLFCDRGVAGDLEKFFEADFSAAKEIPNPLPKRRFTQRLSEGLARLFSPIL